MPGDGGSGKDEGLHSDAGGDALLVDVEGRVACAEAAQGDDAGSVATHCRTEPRASLSALGWRATVASGKLALAISVGFVLGCAWTAPARTDVALSSASGAAVDLAASAAVSAVAAPGVGTGAGPMPPSRGELNPWTCTDYPGSVGTIEERCEAGASAGDGWVYVFDAARFGPAPLCNMCACCRRPRTTPPKLSEEELQRCDFEILMFDTRSITGHEQADIPYWSFAAALNNNYAEKFGYGFRFLHAPDAERGDWFQPQWEKVSAIKHRLDELGRSAAPGSCTWLLYLDTDAYVRMHDTPLHTFLSALAARRQLPDKVSMILAQEEPIPGWFDPPEAWINTGVMMIEAGNRSQGLVDAWVAARRDLVDPFILHKFPYDQGVFTEFMWPGTEHARGRTRHPLPFDAGLVGLVPMREMNSPWGDFVQHIWGGPGSEKRKTDYLEEFVRLGGQRLPFTMMNDMLWQANLGVEIWEPPPVVWADTS